MVTANTAARLEAAQALSTAKRLLWETSHNIALNETQRGDIEIISGKLDKIINVIMKAN